MSFIFTNHARFEDAASISQLDSVHQRQFQIAARAYTGEDFFDSIEDFFEWNLNEIGEPASCELWQVKTNEQPEKSVYEMWILNVDSGTVFLADSTEQAQIQMIQFGFEYYPENPENISDTDYEKMRRLADEMQKAFQKTFKANE